MIGKCNDCGKEGKVVKHHVCYFPEQITTICTKCHGKEHTKNNKALTKEAKEFRYGHSNGIVMQVDLSDKANEIVTLFKLRNKLKTKQEAINIILEQTGSEF